MRKWIALALAMMMVLGLVGGVVGADNFGSFEVEYLAAPAVAGMLLEAAGLDNRYGTGRDGGNFIRDVADKMNEDDGTYFNGVSKTDVDAYKAEILAFLIGKGADLLPEGQVLWLDASALALVDGDPVETWVDLSGEGNDVTQDTPAYHPTYRTDVLGGKPVLRFDGSDDHLKRTTSENDSLDIRDEITIFVVMESSSNSHGRYVISKNESGGYVDQQYAIEIGDYPDYATFVWGGVYLPMAEGWYPPLNDAGIMVGRYTGTHRQLYWDGDQKLDSLTDPTVSHKQNFSIGRRSNTTDGTGAGWYHFQGDIAEILIYDRALTDSERKMVEAYLSAKYGL